MAVAQRREHARAASAPADAAGQRPAGAPAQRRRHPHLLPGGAAPADPARAIARAYRFERARRGLRSSRRAERKRADQRFWLALTVLLGAVAVIAAVTVHELQRLFGI